MTTAEANDSNSIINFFVDMGLAICTFLSFYNLSPIVTYCNLSVNTYNIANFFAFFVKFSQENFVIIAKSSILTPNLPGI